VAWIYTGWLITLPVTALISSLLIGIIINTLQFGYLVYT